MVSVLVNHANKAFVLVLILISVEDGFCEVLESAKCFEIGLNPYFCGRWFL